MKYGVCIGRFQMPHLGHKHMFDYALARCDRLVILVGTTGCAQSYKNPWTYAEVNEMLRHTLGPEDMGRIQIRELLDEPYDDDAWAVNATFIANDIILAGSEVTLFGHHKDDSSYYLNLFPHWGFEEVPKFEGGFDSTRFRKALIRQSDWTVIYRGVTRGVMSYLLNMDNERLLKLKIEATAIENHDKEWDSEGAQRYGVQHVTVDAFVTCMDHILLIRRGGDIGYNSIALPGGFVNKGERVIDAAFRELQEETGLILPNEIRGIKNGIGATVMFDHPGRSQNGRIFTNALDVDVVTSDGELPLVRASDDALRAWWEPIKHLGRLKPEFYADHFFIAQYLQRKGVQWEIAI